MQMVEVLELESTDSFKCKNVKRKIVVIAPNTIGSNGYLSNYGSENMVKVKLNETGKDCQVWLGGRNYEINALGTRPEMPSRLALSLVANKDLDLIFEASDRKLISNLNEEKLNVFYKEFGVSNKKDLLEKIFPKKTPTQRVKKVVEEVLETPAKKAPAKKTAKKGGKK